MSKKEVKRNTKGRKVKSPIFLMIGLIVFIILTIAIYYIFLNFREIMRIEYEGYAISGKEITETLLGNNSEEDNNKKSIFLTKVYEQDKLYKKVNDYFVGENKKEEINLSYPIYINDNTALYNLSQEIKLITSEFEEVSGYPSLTVSNGIVYNESDLERVDEKEYIFLKNESNIFTNLKEIKIQTVANEYTIPVNSNIYFDKEEIRYYEIKKDTLRYKEIKDVDTQTKVIIGEKQVSYEELLRLLKLVQEENTAPNKEEELIQEDTSKENEEKQEKVEKEEQTENLEEEVTPGAYIKPEVTCSPFKANVYTASTELTIKDPSSKILEPVTFIFRKDGRIYLRKTYTTSGSIEVKGLTPNTSYEIEGSYVYENEVGQKVENTFYKDTITTTGFENLDPITLSFENGEIFSNKIQLKNLKIVSDLQNEAVKGIKRLEVEIGDVIYKLTGENLRKFIAGEAIVYETAEGMRSNQKVYYTIKLYDNQGNELRVENNTGETRTSKQKPSVSIRLNKQNVIDVEIGLNLSNKDKVTLENYRYQIIRPNGEVVKESGLKESDDSIYLNDLDPNQYYTITIYASYDLEDNKGKQENQIIGQTVFATQPLSTLGYLELNTNLTDVKTDSGTVEFTINQDRTDKRLIQILDEIKIELVEIGKYEEEKPGEPEETREGNVIETITITGEELQNLKQGKSKIQVFENLISNTKYNLNITSKVKLGETIEEVAVTYSLKEFVTLKMPAEVQIKNLFVTGDLIDFDVRIEDLDHAVLTNKVRIELRDEKTNLILLEEVNTNEEYTRKTIERLETGKTYTLSFYADQYNEGVTDETYEANYLLKELKIVTETGIIGDIGLTDLSRKETGKNLVDVESEIKWYVYPNFSTYDYYGKEYNKEIKILTLGGNGNNRRAVYDLREYAGQEVTMSFKAKLVSEGENGEGIVYIQNSKQDKNRTIIEGITKEDWKDYQFTLNVDKTGFLGFYIEGGNGVEIQELQVELGDKKTTYEEYKYTLAANIIVNLEDKKGEIPNKDYYIRMYKNDELLQEERYEDMNENNQVIDQIKSYSVDENANYKVELVVKIGEREYVLDTQEFKTSEGKEIKGIRNEEEYLMIQPNGNYMILSDIELSREKGTHLSFGGEQLPFNGTLDFNGNKLILITNDVGVHFNTIGKDAVIENLVLEMHYNNTSERSWTMGLCYYNYGIIKNIIVDVVESNSLPNHNIAPIGIRNYGTLENFVVHFEEPIYGSHSLASTFVYSYSGIIKNGYIYGKNIQAIYKSGGQNKMIGGVVAQAWDRAKIENVYSLITVDVNTQFEENKWIGNIVGQSGGNAEITNVYSTKMSDFMKEMDVGPNVYKNDGKEVKNSYYFSDYTFKNSFDQKVTPLALYDTSFQNQVLNNDGAFFVDDLVENGYYPQINMPSCMPKQEYIPLPQIRDSDLADILSIEVIEQGSDYLTAKVNVHNPSGETITEIKVKDLTCDILEQTYQNGQSEVMIRLYNPIKYVSNYSVLSITTKGAYNIPYTRTFEENERTISVDLYREINSIQDWKQINNSPTENYMLMTDLDFVNEGSTIRISNSYSGKLEGNGYTLKNLKLGSSLIHHLSGKIHNVKIENVTFDNGVSYALILTSDKNAVLDQIQVKNITADIEEKTTVFGGLVAFANASTIRNCFVNGFKVESSREIPKLEVGGIVGRSTTSTITNSYVQNLEIQVENALETSIGGLVGKEEGKGSIQYAYAVGKITTGGKNAGGIVGQTKGNIQNTYSFVSISSITDYLGGIAGFDNGTNSETISQNLSLGNLYTNVDTNYIGRISGNRKNRNQNYAYANQKINGYKTENRYDAVLLTQQDLFNKQTYQNKLNFEEGFDLSKVENGILPKLYKENSKELLEGQQDNYLPVEEDIFIEEVEAEKIDVGTISIRITIQNPTGIPITGITIRDMEGNITRNMAQNGKTYIEMTAKPTRYYDSYAITEIEYESNGEKHKKEAEAKINVQFYKELYNYEDWQAIEAGTYQNYRLMNDIDFSGKIDMKTNIKVGRLDGNGHAIRNVNISWNQENAGIIYAVKSEMKNIIFENITIQNTASGEKTGIVVSNTGNLEGITLHTITIEAPNMNYVGIISKNDSKTAEKIELNEIKVKGKRYVSGLMADTYAGDLKNIKGTSLHIEGSEGYVGCILGNVGIKEASMIQNISIEQSEVIGKDRTGGIAGYISYDAERKITLNDIEVLHSRIEGTQFVGGIAGYSSFNQNVRVEDCDIIGTDQVGGGIGYIFCNISDGDFSSLNIGIVDNVRVKATGGYVGGFVGQKGGLSPLVQIRITDSIIKSDGNSVGGIVGYNERGIRYSCVRNTEIIGNTNVGGISGENRGTTNIEYNYVQDSTVKGNFNIGGITGSTISGRIYNTYNNAEITAYQGIAGGLIGYFYNGDMTDAYNDANFYHNYTVSKINSSNKTGGLIGDMEKELYNPEKHFYRNYVQVEIETEDERTASVGIGGFKSENDRMPNTYIYQYSKINGKNVKVENDTFTEEQYVKEDTLKEESFYRQKLLWGTHFIYDVLQEGKYPIINAIELGEQEGIPLPIDSEHMVDEENAGISSLSEQEDLEQIRKNETLQATFDYEGKKIETYETYTKITLEDRTTVIRPERMYVKEGKLYVLDGSLDMVVNNFVVDSYNGKEYETILGTDGKLYDLKESLHYPENFKNKEIKEIGNNLDTEAKEMTVTYQDGSYVRFNYQTGEIIEEQKVEQKVSLFSYIAEAFEKENVMLEPSKENYEESKDLMGKLEKLPIEEAKERKASEEANSNTANQNEIVENQTMNGQTEQENNLMSNGITSKEKTYISKYNSKTGEYEVYDEEEILESKESEVISEEEKIEKENLNEYYSEEKRTEENAGIVWIMLSIAGAVIILMILGKKMTAKKKKDPNTRTRK